MQMTSKERLTRAARGQEVDRVPAIGGWLGGAPVLAELAGCSKDEYLADPYLAVIKAHKALDVDGMVLPIVPSQWDEVRGASVLEDGFEAVEPEDLLTYANSLPDNESEILRSFDAARMEREFRDYFENAFARWEGIVPVPNFWDLGGHFPLYYQFGYIAFLSACALYPEAVGKIWWAKSLPSRERAKILVRLYREYDLVPLLYCGEDLCNNKGPMVAPELLRGHYFPTVRMITEPLVDAGIRLVHHCDGDIRPLLNDFIDAGFSGLQGFQYEIGLDPCEFRRLRSLRGEELILFAGMNVTRTMPFGTPQDVRDEVDYLFDVTDGGRGMFLFTSNTTGPEVPAENIRAGYRHIKTLIPGQPHSPKRRQWPWSLKTNSNLEIHLSAPLSASVCDFQSISISRFGSGESS